MILTQISRSRASSSQKSLHSLHIYLCFRLFRNFLGDFWIYLGMNSFSQRISNIYGNEKFGRFNVVLKLDFEV